MAAYQAHDRVVAADSKPAATLALLQDWWAAWQQAEHDPAQEVIVLAARRAEVDRLNTACQELLAARGRLGAERLQVEDRQLAVGDRVVCGHNAIAELGVANGSRGTITALDPQARTLTIRLDGTDGREVTLPRSYLDGRGRGERNRRVDLAYATTGHRAQGLTRGRALVRLTGSEDVNWLYVQLSRARQDTRLYAVVGPEPQGAGGAGPARPGAARRLPAAGPGPVPGWRPDPGHRHPQQPGSPAAVHGRVAGRAGPAPPPARPGPPRPQPRARPGHRPPPAGRGRPWPPTSSPPAASRPACFAGCAAATTSRPRCRVGWRWPPSRPTGPMTGSGSCASTSSAATAGWKPTPTSAPSIGRWCGPWPGSGAPPAWPSKPTGPAMSWRRSGPVPESTRGRRAWRQAAAEIEHYRRTYQHHRPGPGPRPRAARPGPAGRPAAGPHGHRAGPGQAARHRPHPRRASRPASAPASRDLSEQRGRPGPERAAG